MRSLHFGNRDLGAHKSNLRLPHSKILTLLFAALTATATAQDKIDRYIRAEMELNQIPGLALAVVQDGQISHLRAYGVRSVTSSGSVTPDVPFELASVSKALTAMAILQLEREGLLEQEAPVTSYLRDLQVASDPWWQRVTVKHLLRHTSGLRRETDFRVPCCGPPEEHLVRALEVFREAELASLPGETFSYANSNYTLLAVLVERLSSRTFPEYMREKVFLPFGMQRTTLDPEQARAWGRAGPHEWQWGRVRPSSSRFFGWYGASLAKSSGADMGRYLQALLGSSEEYGPTPMLGAGWWQDLERGYDLGWYVQTEAHWLAGELALEHSGDIWGGNTATILAPRLRAGVAVLTNLGTNRANRIARGVLRHLVGLTIPEPRSMDRSEIPDTWAIVFTSVAGVLLIGPIFGVLRVRGQIRRGERAYSPTLWGFARAAILIAITATLLYVLFRLAPPLEVFPTTMKVAMPLMVFAVVILLVSSCFLGFFGRIRRSAT